MVKRCSKCGEQKALEEFARDKRCPDGRTARCLDCYNAYLRARYAANRERLKESNRVRNLEWRHKHPERARRNSANALRRLKERDPDYFRRWYWANVEKERERAKLVMRDFREAHPERAREHRQRYRKANPEIIQRREAENTHRRRALMKNSSPETAKYIGRLYKEPCTYCGSTENITIDHIVPLSRGGKHEPANLAPACVTCNCSKGAKLLEEWIPQKVA